MTKDNLSSEMHNAHMAATWSSLEHAQHLIDMCCPAFASQMWSERTRSCMQEWRGAQARQSIQQSTSENPGASTSICSYSGLDATYAALISASLLVLEPLEADSWTASCVWLMPPEPVPARVSYRAWTLGAAASA